MRWSLIPLVVLLLVPQVLLSQEAYSTLADATWGNERASFAGVPIPTLLDSLIASEPLVLGLPGRSVTFLDGSESCILAGLPAGGRPTALPEIGDAVVDSSCVLPEGFPANRRGKFGNPLLGETVALSLNVRLDEGLGAVQVQPIMETVQALSGYDGLWGTDDDTLCADCDTMTVRIPGSVLSAVTDSMGLASTIDGVLALANSSLSGETYDVRFRHIWHAVKNLNRAFKRSRFLIESAPVDTVIPVFLTGPPARHEAGPPSSEISFGALSPVSGRSTIHLSLPEAATIRISAYNVAGRRVETLVDGPCDRGELWLEFPSQARVPSGVYFLRASVLLESSGRETVRTAKVLLVR